MSAKPANKPVIGIVGGIGSGKSEVAKLFARSGGMLFDADSEVRNLITDEIVKKKIRDYFGAAVFDLAGNVARPIKELSEFSESSFIVLDVPLLLEKNWRKLCSLIVFIDCNDAERLRRCLARGWTEAEWKNRENAQMSLTKKASICDHIIDNSVSYDHMVKQVNDLLKLWNLP